MNYDNFIIEQREKDWDLKKINTILSKLENSSVKINEHSISQITKEWNKTHNVDDPDIKGVLELYSSMLSCTQSFRSTAGKGFETLICNILNDLHIKYSREIIIDKNG